MIKSYLVTGASRGIGKAIAKQLIEQGHSVYGVARQFDWQDSRLIPINLDLSDLKSLSSTLKQLSSEMDSLEGIICSAGQGKFGSLEEFSFSQIQEIMNLNFLSTAYLIKAFLPFFKRQKRGDIIVIGSEAALSGKKQGSVYCASKFALRGFCQALREECASSNVRVTLINPGMVRTDFFQDLHFECGRSFNEHILPKDIADTVSYILSARAGIVFDEINLSPQKKNVIFKPKM